MISPSKLIEVANETIVFQGTNKMPSLENCERHEKTLSFLAKHKDEMKEARSKTIDRVIRNCKDRAKRCLAPTLPQMKEALRALGFSIGTAKWPEISRAVASALMNRPKRTVSNWLQICERLRTEDAILRVMAGGNAELEKRK